MPGSKAILPPALSEHVLTISLAFRIEFHAPLVCRSGTVRHRGVLGNSHHCFDGYGDGRTERTAARSSLLALTRLPSTSTAAPPPRSRRLLIENRVVGSVKLLPPVVCPILRDNMKCGTSVASAIELVIRPRSGWQPIEWRDAFRYRELLGFLVWRDIKIRYRQTLLGGVWAILQPLLAMVLFTLLFHRITGIQSDGTPYPLFVFAGTSAWMFFSNAVTQSSQSVVGNQQLVSKVYFPRIFIPLGAVGALLVDLALSLTLQFPLMLYYHWPVSIKLATLPVFVLGAVLAASGAGLILSALNVSFRDVKYAVPFLIQMGLFVTPVIYPIRYIPGKWKILLGLNPMTGVIMGFRYALLGSEASWRLVSMSLAADLAIFAVGLFVFRRMEIRFSDVI